jgi:hypothetical protein
VSEVCCSVAHVGTMRGETAKRWAHSLLTMLVLQLPPTLPDYFLVPPYPVTSLCRPLQHPLTPEMQSSSPVAHRESSGHQGTAMPVLVEMSLQISPSRLQSAWAHVQSVVCLVLDHQWVLVVASARNEKWKGYRPKRVAMTVSLVYLTCFLEMCDSRRTRSGCVLMLRRAVKREAVRDGWMAGPRQEPPIAPSLFEIRQLSAKRQPNGKCRAFEQCGDQPSF